MYNVCIIGDILVGSTSLLRRYTENKYEEYPCSIGVEFGFRNISLEGNKTRVELRAASGKERYRPLVPIAMRDAKGVVLIYAVTKQRSLYVIPELNELVKKYTDPDCVVYLVGNQCDAINEREVSIEQGQVVANIFGWKHFEVSAKTGENVDGVFYALLKELKQVRKTAELREIEEKKKNPSINQSTFMMKVKNLFTRNERGREKHKPVIGNCQAVLNKNALDSNNEDRKENLNVEAAGNDTSTNGLIGPELHSKCFSPLEHRGTEKASSDDIGCPENPSSLPENPHRNTSNLPEPVNLQYVLPKSCFPEDVNPGPVPANFCGPIPVNAQKQSIFLNDEPSNTPGNCTSCIPHEILPYICEPEPVNIEHVFTKGPGCDATKSDGNLEKNVAKEKNVSEVDLNCDVLALDNL